MFHKVLFSFQISVFTFLFSFQISVYYSFVFSFQLSVRRNADEAVQHAELGHEGVEPAEVDVALLAGSCLQSKLQGHGPRELD